MKFLLISVSLFFLILSGTFYVFMFDKGSYAEEGVEGDVLDNLLDYFSGEALEDSYYTPQEILHLEDVRNLVVLNKLIFFGSLIVLGLSLFFLRDWSVVKSGLFYGGLSFLVVLCAFAVLACFNFMDAFTIFHELVFTNDLWFFDYNNTLLTMFPLQFFKNLFIKIITFSGILSFTCLLLSRLCLND